MCVFTVCVFTLDGLNAEHEFRVWVTILGCMSRHFHLILRIEGESLGVIQGVLKVISKCFYTFKFPFDDHWLKGE